MSVNLVKGQKISLVKEAPQQGGANAGGPNGSGYGVAAGMAAVAGAAMLAGAMGRRGVPLNRIVVGLGWDAAPRGAGYGAQPQQQRGLFGSLFGSSSAPRTVEIDCDASAVLLQGGRYVDRRDLVYFGNLNHYSGAVRHMGDNLTGDGEGDDEQIVIDLNSIPPQYDKIVIVVNIFNAEKKKQDFGMISNAFVRIVDAQSGQEFLRYDLSENYPGMTAMIFGEIYRYNNEWKFAAVGAGTRDGSLSELVQRYK